MWAGQDAFGLETRPLSGPRYRPLATPVHSSRVHQIDTFDAKFEKFGILSCELASKSPMIFGIIWKLVKKCPKCSVIREY